MPSDVFDDVRIRDETFVNSVEIHQTIGSTNDRALELCHREDLKLPALVVAGTQTAGRGQRGNHWWSPEGALLFSLLVEKPAHLSMEELSLNAALAVAATAELGIFGNCKGAQGKIRWPNDIYIDDAKIAGLRFESPHVPFDTERLVIGVGLNVNNSCGRTCENQLGSLRATSMKEIAEREISLQEALLFCLQCIEVYSRPETPRRTKGLRDAISKRCYLRGKEVVIHTGTTTLTGQCLGIQPDGTLLVRQENGEEETVTSGTVHSWK